MSSVTISKKTFILLQLKMIKGVGPATLWRTRYIKAIESKTILEILKEIHGPYAGATEEMINSAVTEANLQVAKALQEGDRILSFFDKQFPSKLKTDPNKKVPLIYCRGDISLFEKRVVAVIGTRNPTDEAIKDAERLSVLIVKSKKVVLSGLALGIDTVAHQTTLNEEGKTIAVIATGLDTVYPYENKKLSSTIAEKGLIVTDIPYGFEITKYQFVLRDYTQAVLSDSLVLIQTGKKGGSCHATRNILLLNRFLYVVAPSHIDIQCNKERCLGNSILINKNKKEIEDMLKCRDIDTDLIKII